MPQLRCNTEKSRAKPASPHESPSAGGGSFEAGFLLFFCLEGGFFGIATLAIPISPKNVSFLVMLFARSCSQSESGAGE